MTETKKPTQTDFGSALEWIARTHIARIQTILDTPSNAAEIAAFNAFAAELRDLNNTITDGEIVEMLAQHLITKPVFGALFQDYSFAQHNPMSLAMQDILDKLHEHHIDKEADTLQRFYDSVKLRAEGIDNAAGKQKIVVELYDKFFRNAFPRMTERLGIVYTPVEVVDFILHSVNDALQNEFGQTLGDKNVHIIDPFTGTGTFITRLLQSGLISPAQLPYKYQHEIHANEIVLLAYYIAAINIEAVYHELVGGAYQPFNGICLTDTFQLYEKDDLISQILVDNSARRTKQKALDIRVIIGNPPYSAGQKSANDNNANIAYPKLDDKIRSTYAANSTATNKKALYDSYIRAIRWASDRVGDSGIIGFVTNAGFIEANAADGLRKCLADEFSRIYIFHLRGNGRTSGELRRKEKDNVFGQGSRTPIAISILIKNPHAKEHGGIFMHDIGDYLTREDKLGKISTFKSINGITKANGWLPITPDKHHDWVGQRDDSFGEFISLGDKRDKDAVTVFDNYSTGLQPRGDAWFYNFGKSSLKTNINKSIYFFNSEVERYKEKFKKNDKLDDFVKRDPSQFAWYGDNVKEVTRGMHYIFKKHFLVHSLYRPFNKTWVYFDQKIMHRAGLMPRIFPDSSVENRVIYLSGSGNSGTESSALITNVIPDLNMQHSGGQGFSLRLYEKNLSGDETIKGEKTQKDVFASHEPSKKAKTDGKYTVKDGITDAGLAHFQAAYPFETLTKEGLFYYIYGLLHSEDYKKRYADNLTKELPRIPCVKQAADFWAFSKAGRDLAEWHINYETVEPYPVTFECGKTTIDELKDADFYVTKMKFAKKDDTSTVIDNHKSTVIYNNFITLKNIPLAAYEYVVNGKPALEWVMERQSVTTHKDSGITNDANDWAIETIGNPRYPLELFQRVITVSLETIKIVNALPKLDI